MSITLYVAVVLIGEVYAPIPAAPGHSKLKDDEYVRKGVVSIFMEVNRLAGSVRLK